MESVESHDRVYSEETDNTLEAKLTRYTKEFQRKRKTKALCHTPFL